MRCVPMIARIIVVFPHPLGPSKPVIAASRTATSIPSSTVVPPRTTVSRSQLIAELTM
jgi:hypothetical protein